MNNKKIMTLSLAAILSSLALASCNDGSKVAEEAISKLNIISGYKNAKESFFIPTQVLHDGKTYEIEWTEASDAVEIKPFGAGISYVEITRGAEDVDYELVANIKDFKKVTKTFSGKIAKAEEGAGAVEYVDYANINKFYEDWAAKKVKFDDPISFTGVITQNLSGGAYLTDEGGKVVYAEKQMPAPYTVGDKVKISGEAGAKGTCLRVADYHVEPVSRNNEVKVGTLNEGNPLTVKELADMDVKLGSDIHSKHLKITGVVDVVKGKYVDYLLRDENNYNVKAQFYYKVNNAIELSEVAKYDGKKITAEVIYCAEDKGTQWIALADDFANLAANATELTAEEAIDYHTSAYKVNTSVAEAFDTEWTDNAKTKWALSYVGKDAAGNVVVKPDGTYDPTTKDIPLAVLDVTFTSGENTITRHYPNVATILGKIETVKLSKVMEDKDPAAEVNVEAVVVWRSGQDHIVYEDGKYYYAYAKSSSNKLNPGTKVWLKGKYGIFFGKHQFAFTEILKTEENKTHTPDYSKAVEFDSAKWKEIAKAGITGETLYTNEASKAFMAKHEFNITKMTVKVIEKSSKGGGTYKALENDCFYTPKCDSDVLKDFAVGTELDAYAVVIGGNYKNSTDSVKVLNAFVLKVEPKAAA